MDPLYWSIILIVLGLLVIVSELFIPSAGILGILAATLLLSGIGFGFAAGVKTGALVLLATCMIVPALLAMLVKVWPSTPIGKRILLKNLSSEDVLPNSSHYVNIKQLVGQFGVAKTKMLPSGIVIINHEKVDAVSDGFAIEPGQTVRVISVKGNRVYVEPYDGDPSEAAELPASDGQDILSKPIDELGIDELDLDSLEKP
jgi:membrane-bound serine protease (ClpP class)